MAHRIHETVGEHVYDGMTMNWRFPPELLQRIRASFTLRDNDVLVISYPKSGWCSWSCN